jgi:hypothetical protein
MVVSLPLTPSIHSGPVSKIIPYFIQPPDFIFLLVGVLVSFTANPTSFDNFTQIVPFFKDMGEGAFCIPLDFPSNVNGTNLQDGKNVTIQVTVIFDG